MEQDVRNLVQELEVRWKSLTIANDFVFGKVMLDEDLCKEVLEAILSTDIEKIEYVGRQDAIDVTEDGQYALTSTSVTPGERSTASRCRQLTRTSFRSARATITQCLPFPRLAGVPPIAPSGIPTSYSSAGSIYLGWDAGYTLSKAVARTTQTSA